MDLGKLGAVRDKLMHPLAPVALEVADLRPPRRSGVISDHLKSALGQTFTFRHVNECRLLNAEADQGLTSQECH